MKLWSISFSYRLGLGFHALNNEGSEGSNLMQPRRIDVGSATYDGISGEIIRHHIMESFVDICRRDGISIYPCSEALHPDRGPLGIRQAAKALNCDTLTKQNPEKLYEAIRAALKNCAVLDVGGYLAAWAGERTGAGEAEEAGEDTGSGSTPQTSEAKAVAPEDAIKESLAEIGKKKANSPYTVKRDSVFDAAWLISEQPQDLAITQHAAYRPSGQQSLFSQTMRSNVYGGVIRADLHRIGTDDYWYLQPDNERLAIDQKEQTRRQVALVEAIVNFIASPSGAKVAGWAPHVFLTEGVVLLTSVRTAPFTSPIEVALDDTERPVRRNPSYVESLTKLKNDADTWVWPFSDTSELLGLSTEIKMKLEEQTGGTEVREAENG